MHKFVKNALLENYFIKYKPFLLFLGKFLLAYLLLTFVYQLFLSRFDSAKYETDAITKMVSRQTESLLHFFHADASIIPHPEEASFKIIYNQKYLARIIEGCNAVSVIILFVAFVIAFTGRFRDTVLFIFSGSILIYILNICRIAALSYLLYHYPAQQRLLHDVLFPLCIYGVVFILWIIWVNKFSIYARKTV